MQSEGYQEEVKFLLWFASRTIKVLSSSIKDLFNVLHGLKETLGGFHGIITGQYRREQNPALSNSENFLCCHGLTPTSD